MTKRVHSANTYRLQDKIPNTKTCSTPRTWLLVSSKHQMSQVYHRFAILQNSPLLAVLGPDLSSTDGSQKSSSCCQNNQGCRCPLHRSGEGTCCTKTLPAPPWLVEKDRRRTKQNVTKWWSIHKAHVETVEQAKIKQGKEGSPRLRLALSVRTCNL